MQANHTHPPAWELVQVVQIFQVRIGIHLALFFLAIFSLVGRPQVLDNGDAVLSYLASPAGEHAITLHMGLLSSCPFLR